MAITVTAEAWSAIAAGFSGIAALVALVVSMRTEAARRRHSVNEREHVLQEKLYAMFPMLVDIVGVDDELDPEIRKALVPFFMLYSHVWVTYKEGIAWDPTWRGLRGDFEWWVTRPVARQAWTVASRYCDTWPPGFCDYVNSVLHDADKAEMETRIGSESRVPPRLDVGATAPPADPPQ